jgi:hypothetical protein
MASDDATAQDSLDAIMHSSSTTTSLTTLAPAIEHRCHHSRRPSTGKTDMKPFLMTTQIATSTEGVTGSPSTAPASVTRHRHHRHRRKSHSIADERDKKQSIDSTPTMSPSSVCRRPSRRSGPNSEANSETPSRMHSPLRKHRKSSNGILLKLQLQLTQYS